MEHYSATATESVATANESEVTTVESLTTRVESTASTSALGARFPQDAERIMVATIATTAKIFFIIFTFNIFISFNNKINIENFILNIHTFMIQYPSF